MQENTTATKQVAAEVRTMREEMEAVRLEMEATRGQMGTYTAFLQDCVAKALNGKAKTEQAMVEADIQDRKTIRTRQMKRGESQEELDRIAAEARWRLIERLVGGGLVILFAALFGAEKAGIL